MSKINDGGPAFPRSGFSGPQGYGRPDNGMTLRDWFAATLASGHISTFNPSAEYGPETITAVARNAYRMADAFLAAREKAGGE